MRARLQVAALLAAVCMVHQVGDGERLQLPRDGEVAEDRDGEPLVLDLNQRLAQAVKRFDGEKGALPCFLKLSV